MERARRDNTFSPRRKQSPLVEDVRRAGPAVRKPTSRLEQRWPVYLGVGIPALVFGGAFLMLAGGLISEAKLSLGTFAFALPFFLIPFILTAVVLTYVVSSIRSSAETLGNISFLSQSSTGFKIGGALGFVLFLWFTPIVFGDPFAGNPSAPSAIVAQLALKALTFLGIAGAIGSRIEKAIRGQKPNQAPPAQSRTRWP